MIEMILTSLHTEMEKDNIDSIEIIDKESNIPTLPTMEEIIDKKILI